MARTEILPDGRAVLVPDDMTREEALAITGFSAAAPPPPAGGGGGQKSDFIDDIQRGIGGLMSGVGSALRDIDDSSGSWLQGWGNEIVQNNPADYASLSDINGIGDLIGFTGERIAEMAPQLGGAAIASLVGSPVAGAVIMGGTTGVTSYGESRETQRQTGEYDPLRAALTAVPAGALDVLGLGRVLPGSGKLLGEVFKGGLKGAAKAAGKVGLEEATTEVAQQALQRYGGLQDLGSPEAMQEYGFAAMAGALAGGSLGGARGFFGGVEAAPGEETPPGATPPPSVTPVEPIIPPNAPPELATAEPLRTFNIPRPDETGEMQDVPFSVLSEPDENGNVWVRTPEGSISAIPEPILTRMEGAATAVAEPTVTEPEVTEPAAPEVVPGETPGTFTTTTVINGVPVTTTGVTPSVTPPAPAAVPLAEPTDVLPPEPTVAPVTEGAEIAPPPAAPIAAGPEAAPGLPEAPVTAPLPTPEPIPLTAPVTAPEAAAPVEEPAMPAIEQPAPEPEATQPEVAPEPEPEAAPEYVFTPEHAKQLEQYDPELARNLVGKTASTAAKMLGQSSSSPFYQQLGNRIAGVASALERNGIQIPITVTGRGAGKGGALWWTTGFKGKPDTAAYVGPVPGMGFDVVVRGRPGKRVGAVGVNQETLLHELLHSVLIGTQFTSKAFPPNSRVGKAVEDMKALTSTIRQGVVDIIDGKIQIDESVKESLRVLARSNAFKDEREVIAWGLTNWDMQNLLKAIPTKSGNAFTDFVRLIGRMLGIGEKDFNALRDLIEISERLLPENEAELAEVTKATQEALGIKPTPFQSATPGVAPMEIAEQERAKGYEQKGYIPDAGTRKSNLAAFMEGSVAVNPDGSPITLYHGTSKDKAFNKFNVPRNGAWFTTRPEEASSYAEQNDSQGHVLAPTKENPWAMRETNTASRVVPVYLSIKNPKVYEDPSVFNDEIVKASGDNYKRGQGILFDKLRAQGHDGVVLGNGIYVVLNNPGQIKSAVGNRGTFSPMKASIVEQVREEAEPDVPPAAVNEQGRSYVQIPLGDETRMDKFRRIWADKMRRLGFVEESIENATGHAMPRTARATEAAALFEGRAQERLDELQRDHINKIIDVMRRLDITPNEADLFLLARTAEDRNAKIAKRNPNMPDGGSGLTNAEARAILAEFASSGRMEKMQQLAREVDAMTAKTRETMVKYGMLRQEQADALVRDEPFYVPLKGLAEGEDMSVSGDNVNRPPNSGRGFAISRKEFLAAKGRSSLPYSPLANAMADAQAAIVRGERNRVGQSFLNNIAKKFDSNAWQVFTDENPERQSIYNSKTGKVETRPVQMELFPDRYFIVKENGKPYYIKIHDPLLMRALTNGSSKDFAAVNKFLGSTIGVATQALSRLHTTLNPEFFVPNFARDIEAAVFNILAEQDAVDGRLAGKKIVSDVIKDIKSIKNFKMLFKATFNHEATTNEQREVNALFQQAKEDGAFTGWILQETPEAQMEKIQKELTKANATGKEKVWYDTREKAASLFQKIQDFNSVFENVTRFAVYKNALKAGLTRDEAANMARNVTVDFNKKGEAGPTANAIYAFFNAAVRGNAQLIRSLTAKSADGKYTRAQKLAMGMVAFGVLQAMIARGMSDEDDDGALFYDKIPDWEKQRNLIMMMPNGREYIKIPLPYGYSFFHTMGTLFADAAAGQKTSGDVGMGVLSGLLNNFSPVPLGGETLSGIAASTVPTVLKPFADLMINQNFFGSPIYNEPFDEDQAMSSVSRYSTPEGYKAIVEFLNDATGGKGKVAGAVDLPAESLQYLVNSFIGGAGKFGADLVDLGGKMVSGRDVEMRNVPVMRKVLGEPSTQNDLGLYYDRLNTIQPIERQFRDSFGEDRRTMREKFPVETNPRVILAMKDAQKQIKEVNKQKKNLLQRDMDYGAQQDRLDKLNERQHEIYLRFNRIYNQVKERED